MRRDSYLKGIFISFRVNQENKDGVNGVSQGSTGLQEMNRIRTKVVQELINTEQDFVQHLRDIVEVWFPGILLTFIIIIFSIKIVSSD